MKEKLVNLAKSRYFIPTIMMMISLSLVAYAVTSVSVHNTVTITSGASVQIIYQTTPFGTTCPSLGYSTTPPSVAFIEHQGGSNTTYLCVNNIGTGSDTPSISITGGDPTCGTSPCFSVTPTSLPAIPAGGFSAPTALTVTNAPTTPMGPVDLVITVT